MSWAFRDVGSVASSTTGGNVSPGLPSGTAEGDLLVCVVATKDASINATMSGWTAIDPGTLASGAGGTVRQQAFRKIAGGGEGAPTVTYSGTTGIIARVAGWSGINTVSTVDVDGANTVNSNNNATVTFAAVTTTADNDLVVFLGVDEGTGGTFIGVISGSPTPTERFDSVIGTTGPHIFLADMNNTPAGSTISRTATLSVGGARIGRQISFRQLNTFSQSLSATEVASATLAKPITRIKSMLASTPGLAVLSRALVLTVDLSAAAAGVAAIALGTIRAVVMAATSSAVGLVGRAATFARSITSVAGFAPTVATATTRRLLLNATAAGAPTITLARVFARALSAGLLCVASLVPLLVAATTRIPLTIHARLRSLRARARIEHE